MTTYTASRVSDEAWAVHAEGVDKASGHVFAPNMREAMSELLDLALITGWRGRFVVREKHGTEIAVQLLAD